MGKSRRSRRDKNSWGFGKMILPAAQWPHSLISHSTYPITPRQGLISSAVEGLNSAVISIPGFGERLT